MTFEEAERVGDAIKNLAAILDRFQLSYVGIRFTLREQDYATVEGRRMLLVEGQRGFFPRTLCLTVSGAELRHSPGVIPEWVIDRVRGDVTGYEVEFTQW